MASIHSIWLFFFSRSHLKIYIILSLHFKSWLHQLFFCFTFRFVNCRCLYSKFVRISHQHWIKSSFFALSVLIIRWMGTSKYIYVNIFPLTISPKQKKEDFMQNQPTIAVQSTFDQHIYKFLCKRKKKKKEKKQNERNAF